MICSNCGANLEQGVLFCRECGSKVAEKRFCRECGKELEQGQKYCSSCGADIDFVDKEMNLISKEENDSKERYSSFTNTEKKKEVFNAAQIQKKKKVLNKKTIVVAIVMIVVILLAVLVFKYIQNGNGSRTNLIPTFTTTQSEDYSVELGTQYAYMSDEWNVYIAEPVSETVIKIEHWDKTMSFSKTMKYSEDIGSFKITDTENGFAWIDDEHTAFVFKLTDKNNSRIKGQEVVFTVNIDDDDKCKGSDYNEKIACYTYQNDDWHEYRAIPLTDKLIKIEVWYRGSTLGKFLYGYDMCVLNIESKDTDFEWNRDYSSFSITLEDTANKSNWKGATLVSFTLEKSKYSYYTVEDYLKEQILSEEKQQKDGFEENSLVEVGNYSFLIPSYWKADIEKTNQYRAYAETSGKVAMLEIEASYDSDPVTYDALAKETEDGKMSEAFASWYDSCRDVLVKDFDNGNVKGFVYSAKYIQEGHSGTSVFLCFPDEKSNSWMYVILCETDNTEYSYTNDFEKVLNSTSVSD